MLATCDFTISQANTTDFGRGSLALGNRPQKRSRTPRKAPAAGSVCLVVSPDPLRQLMFGKSAEQAGWRQSVCVDQQEALRQLASGMVGMVLVDTVSIGDHSVAQRRQLVQLLAGQKDVLTVVCGKSSDVEEEIWARQHAAWMYLPGVAPETDLQSVLCGAKEIAQRNQLRRAQLNGAAA